jgi:hypothetical protein
MGARVSRCREPAFTTMNMNHTKHVTIGVCPFFSLNVTRAIHRRKVRDAITARRRQRFARITGVSLICGIVKNLLATLRKTA